MDTSVAFSTDLLNEAAFLWKCLLSSSEEEAISFLEVSSLPPSPLSHKLVLALAYKPAERTANITAKLLPLFTPQEVLQTFIVTPGLRMALWKAVCNCVECLVAANPGSATWVPILLQGIATVQSPNFGSLKTDDDTTNLLISDLCAARKAFSDLMASTSGRVKAAHEDTVSFIDMLHSYVSGDSKINDTLFLYDATEKAAVMQHMCLVCDRVSRTVVANLVPPKPADKAAGPPTKAPPQAAPPRRFWHLPSVATKTAAVAAESSDRLDAWLLRDLWNSLCRARDELVLRHPSSFLYAHCAMTTLNEIPGNMNEDAAVHFFSEVLRQWETSVSSFNSAAQRQLGRVVELFAMQTGRSTLMANVTVSAGSSATKPAIVSYVAAVLIAAWRRRFTYAGSDKLACIVPCSTDRDVQLLYQTEISIAPVINALRIHCDEVLGHGRNADEHSVNVEEVVDALHPRASCVLPPVWFCRLVSRVLCDAAFKTQRRLDMACSFRWHLDAIHGPLLRGIQSGDVAAITQFDPLLKLTTSAIEGWMLYERTDGSVQEKSDCHEFYLETLQGINRDFIHNDGRSTAQHAWSLYTNVAVAAIHQLVDRTVRCLKAVLKKKAAGSSEIQAVDIAIRTGDVPIACPLCLPHPVPAVIPLGTESVSPSEFSASATGLLRAALRIPEPMSDVPQELFSSQRWEKQSLLREASTASSSKSVRNVEGSAKDDTKSHFLSVRLLDASCHKMLTGFQEEIISKQPSLRPHTTKVSSFHITLGRVYTLNTDWKVAKAQAVLRATEPYLKKFFGEPTTASPAPCSITLRGVGHFNNRVLYAKPVEDDSLAKLRLATAFLERAMHDCEKEPAVCDVAALVEAAYSFVTSAAYRHRGQFTPHATLFKYRNNRVKPVPLSEFLTEYNDKQLGAYPVFGIQLNRLAAGEKETGYYPCDLLVPLATDEAISTIHTAAGYIPPDSWK